MISIILPIYNGADYAERCIESILSQTFKSFELWIIDDYSEDSIEEIVEQYNDYRIHYMKTDDRQGFSNAKNLGLQLISGEELIFISVEDYWEPNLLETLHLQMEQNQEDIVIGGFVKEDKSGRVQGKSLSGNLQLSGHNLLQGYARNEFENYEIWGKLIKVSMVKGIEFSSQAQFANRIFMTKVYYHATKIKYTSTILWHRLINDERFEIEQKASVQEKIRLKIVSVVFRVSITQGMKMMKLL